MTVFVIFTSTPFEGCSEPLEVFTTEEAARTRADELIAYMHMNYLYTELDVEGG